MLYQKFLLGDLGLNVGLDQSLHMPIIYFSLRGGLRSVRSAKQYLKSGDALVGRPACQALQFVYINIDIPPKPDTVLFSSL